jgi:hypothetical protein
MYSAEQLQKLEQLQEQPPQPWLQDEQPYEQQEQHELRYEVLRKHPYEQPPHPYEHPPQLAYEHEETQEHPHEPAHPTEHFRKQPLGVVNAIASSVVSIISLLRSSADDDTPSRPP